MSKALQVIGVVLGGIVAGIATGGVALLAAGGIAAAGALGTALVWGGVTAALTLAGGTLTTVASWSSAGAGISPGSPTYTWGKLQTQTSNCLAIPIIYGECKVAGNTIWQSSTGGAVLHKLVALADGEIEAITDVKINNKAIESLPGCSYNPYFGTSTQTIDARVTGSNNTQRAQTVGGLRNTAYIALSATASSELSGGVNLTTVVRGSKIKVYSDLENYTLQYSNNPSWCILDFLTRYNGAGIPMEEIDLQSFINAAQYCDQMVGEEGKQQKRFTTNIVLDEKKSRLDWLENLLISCRGYTFYQGGKLSLQIEKAENSMQLFDKDNILSGSEKFWTTPREKKIDIFKIQYIDPQNEYARIFAHAQADEFENEQPIVQEVQAWGITNFNQASRLAWYYLNQAKTCGKFISFRTSQEGLDRTIGDVIEVTSTFLGYQNKKMRIIHMAQAQEGQIEIICKEYNAALYSDTLGSVEPVVNKTSLPDVFDVPPTPVISLVEEIGWRTPEGNHVATIKVAWDEVDYFYLSHYELSYSDDGGTTWSQGNISYDGVFIIQNAKTNVEYLIKVQSVTHKNIFSEPAQTSILTIGKNNPPASVPIFNVIQKDEYLKAVITPPDEPDLQYFEIRKGLSWDDAEFVQKFFDKTTLFKPTQEGTNTYLVKAVDNVGNYSINATKAVVNVSGLVPKNIIIEKTFYEDDFEITDGETLLPIIDLGINFQDFRYSKETGLKVCADSSDEIWYRCGYYDFEGWDYIEYDVHNWEDNAQVKWSNWKNLTSEPDFTGEFVQVKLTGTNSTYANIICDIEDVEDIILNKNIEDRKTTISLNKTFTIPPTITATTVDNGGKICSWKITNIQKNRFDIELLDINDNLIEGRLLAATARGY